MKQPGLLIIPVVGAAVAGAIIWQASANSVPALRLPPSPDLALSPSATFQTTDNARDPAPVFSAPPATPVATDPPAQNEQPDQSREALELIQSLRDHGRAEDAEQVFAESVAIVADSVGVAQAESFLAWRARSLAQTRDYERAQTAWVLLLDHFPEGEHAAEGWTRRAEHLSRTKQDPAEVERAFREAVRLGGETDSGVHARRSLAGRYRQQGRWSECATQCEEILSSEARLTDAMDRWASLLLAYAYERNGEVDPAREVLSELADRYPGSREVANARAALAVSESERATA